jgi:hypothetical protein
VPFLLVKLGERDQAQRVLEALDLQGVELGFAGIDISLLGVEGDPLIRAYQVRCRQRDESLRRRFGNP